MNCCLLIMSHFLFLFLSSVCTIMHIYLIFVYHLFFQTETSTNVLKTDKGVKKTNNNLGHMDIGKFLIISTGSALSIALISVIMYELHKYQKLSSLNAVQPAHYNVYDEICALHTQNYFKIRSLRVNFNDNFSESSKQAYKEHACTFVRG